MTISAHTIVHLSKEEDVFVYVCLVESGARPLWEIFRSDFLARSYVRGHACRLVAFLATLPCSLLMAFFFSLSSSCAPAWLWPALVRRGSSELTHALIRAELVVRRAGLSAMRQVVVVGLFAYCPLPVAFLTVRQH